MQRLGGYTLIPWTDLDMDSTQVNNKRCIEQYDPCPAREKWVVRVDHASKYAPFNYKYVERFVNLMNEAVRSTYDADDGDDGDDGGGDAAKSFAVKCVYEQSLFCVYFWTLDESVCFFFVCGCPKTAKDHNTYKYFSIQDRWQSWINPNSILVPTDWPLYDNDKFRRPWGAYHGRCALTEEGWIPCNRIGDRWLGPSPYIRTTRYKSDTLNIARYLSVKTTQKRPPPIYMPFNLCMNCLSGYGPCSREDDLTVCDAERKKYLLWAHYLHTGSLLCREWPVSHQEHVRKYMAILEAAGYSLALYDGNRLWRWSTGVDIIVYVGLTRFDACYCYVLCWKLIKGLGLNWDVDIAFYNNHDESSSSFRMQVTEPGFSSIVIGFVYAHLLEASTPGDPDSWDALLAEAAAAATTPTPWTNNLYIAFAKPTDWAFNTGTSRNENGCCFHRPPRNNVKRLRVDGDLGWTTCRYTIDPWQPLVALRNIEWFVFRIEELAQRRAGKEAPAAAAAAMKMVRSPHVVPPMPPPPPSATSQEHERQVAEMDVLANTLFDVLKDTISYVCPYCHGLVSVHYRFEHERACYANPSRPPPPRFFPKTETEIIERRLLQTLPFSNEQMYHRAKRARALMTFKNKQKWTDQMHLYLTTGQIAFQFVP